MNEKSYDVLVIGAGIAGYYCSRSLAKKGKKVALIEEDSIGGTALRWGALPVKKMLDSIKADKADNIIKNYDKEIEKLQEIIMANIESKNIDIFYGKGRFINSKAYQLGDNVLRSQYIVIATGTRAASIKEIPIDGHRIITHKEAIDFKNIPESIIIIGASVEGIEFASIYAELGIQVTVIEKENRILIDNDHDLVLPIESRLIDKGVKIIKGFSVNEAIAYENGVLVTLENSEKIKADKALVTFHRKANFPLGLENTRIKTDANRIIVDDCLKTSEENIFAIGDINGLVGMAHTAINQGLKVADFISSSTPIKLGYDLVPRAVFTLPEMAGLGKQEWELKGLPYKVYTHEFKNTWRGWSKGIENGFIKIITDDNDTILGIWMVGDNVSEYIGLMSILMKKGFTLEDIRSNLIIHPSLMEIMIEAIL